jgi:hypothetical protein
MSISEPLNETNFLLYAAKSYDNPQCFDTLEFYDDINRFKYLKRLFNKYVETGELRERLILNHIVILCNVFGPVVTTRMLFFKLQGYEQPLKPFLVYLSLLPDTVTGIGLENRTINTVDIPLDPNVVDRLRKFNNGDANTQE